MFLRLETLQEKKLVGKSLRMSIAENDTFKLWDSFMPQRNQIKNVVGTDLYAVQVYDSPDYFKNFNPAAIFTKWALIEVSEFNDIPSDMKSYTLKGGRYAVFIHKGSPKEFAKTLHHIFKEWLPSSAYELDHREHFEVLGDSYKNNDPNSEEEIWIPIRHKQPIH